MSRTIYAGLLASLLVGIAAPSAQATQIPWCMRVVPSGDLVIWYGSCCR